MKFYSRNFVQHLPTFTAFQTYWTHRFKVYWNGRERVEVLKGKPRYFHIERSAWNLFFPLLGLTFYARNNFFPRLAFHLLSNGSNRRRHMPILFGFFDVIFANVKYFVDGADDKSEIKRKAERNLILHAPLCFAIKRH